MADVWTATPEKLEVYAKALRALVHITGNGLDCVLGADSAFQGTGVYQNVLTEVIMPGFTPWDYYKFYIPDLQGFVEFLRRAAKHAELVSFHYSKAREGGVIQAEAEDWARWRMWFRTCEGAREDGAFSEQVEYIKAPLEGVKPSEVKTREMDVETLKTALSQAVERAEKLSRASLDDLRILIRAIGELARLTKTVSVTLIPSKAAMRIRFEIGEEDIIIKITALLLPEVFDRLPLAWSHPLFTSPLFQPVVPQSRPGGLQ